MIYPNPNPVVYRSVSNAGIAFSTEATGAFVDGLPAAVTTNYCTGGYSVSFFDDTGKAVEAIASAVGTVETLGAVIKGE